ncbi:hypothetical protein F4818DRAFT_438229 [Hypoxylon cercidicola]|nr:hypothetical protein F4818DRAFT_438229 [Hypoxylon cercidicola]
MSIFDALEPPPNQWADDMSLEDQKRRKQQQIDAADILIESAKDAKRKLAALGPPTADTMDALYVGMEDVLRECDKAEAALPAVGSLPPSMAHLQRTEDFENLGIGSPLSDARAMQTVMEQELLDLRGDVELLDDELQLMKQAKSETNETNSLFGESDGGYAIDEDESYEDFLGEGNGDAQGTKRHQDDDPDDPQENKRIKKDIEPPSEDDEPMPEAAEPILEAAEPVPEATESAPEAAEPSLEVIEPTLEATEPILEPDATEPISEDTESSPAPVPTPAPAITAATTSPAATSPVLEGILPIRSGNASSGDSAEGPEGDDLPLSEGDSGDVSSSEDDDGGVSPAANTGGADAEGIYGTGSETESEEIDSDEDYIDSEEDAPRGRSRVPVPKKDEGDEQPKQKAPAKAAGVAPKGTTKPARPQLQLRLPRPPAPYRRVKVPRTSRDSPSSDEEPQYVRCGTGWALKWSNPYPTRASPKEIRRRIRRLRRDRHQPPSS